VRGRGFLRASAVARQLSAKRGNAEVVALILGRGVQGMAGDLPAYGADRVLCVDHPSLEKYLSLPYTGSSAG